MASQLPPQERHGAAGMFAAAAATAAVAAVAPGLPSLPSLLVRASVSGINAALTRRVGVLDGSPQAIADRVVNQVRRGFNAGAVAAVTAANTETLDAYRVTAQRVHTANDFYVAGWVWQAACDRRSCPSCWAMHGTFHPLTVAGPQDHRNGRCARVVKLRDWRQLGIGATEPADRIPDAQARFTRMSAADQVAVMGPARIELLRSGAVTWADLAVRRTDTRWRPHYVPRTVAELQSIARARASAAA